jgi:hypothetical protein
VLKIGGTADLLAYVGHDAFMDFQMPPISGTNANGRPVILACESKYFFAPISKKLAPLLCSGQPA